jgi:hypothetical protein
MANDVKLTDQARRVDEAIERCFRELAGPDGLPKQIPETGGFYKITFDQNPPLDVDLHRLVSWLNVLAEKNEDLAYASLLQILLDLHGVRWPDGVFTKGHDLSSQGRGAPWKCLTVSEVKEIEKLQSEGKTWAAIAVHLGHVLEKAPLKERRRAGERLRKLPHEVDRPFDSLHPCVTDKGLQMLGY